MAATCWWYYIAKFTEFFDTFFFNLRKKTEHVSTLHVIHHGCMPFSVWLGLKFAPGNFFANTAKSHTLALMHAYTISFFLYLTSSSSPLSSNARECWAYSDSNAKNFNVLIWIFKAFTKAFWRRLAICAISNFIGVLYLAICLIYNSFSIYKFHVDRIFKWNELFVALLLTSNTIYQKYVNFIAPCVSWHFLKLLLPFEMKWNAMQLIFTFILCILNYRHQRKKNQIRKLVALYRLVSWTLFNWKQ